MDVDEKNRERRRAAYEHASKVHERAAKAESDAADLFESLGERRRPLAIAGCQSDRRSLRRRTPDEPPSTPKTALDPWRRAKPRPSWPVLPGIERKTLVTRLEVFKACSTCFAAICSAFGCWRGDLAAIDHLLAPSDLARLGARRQQSARLRGREPAQA